jgi:hypothetical protein
MGTNAAKKKNRFFRAHNLSLSVAKQSRGRQAGRQVRREPLRFDTEASTKTKQTNRNNFFLCAARFVGASCFSSSPTPAPREAPSLVTTRILMFEDLFDEDGGTDTSIPEWALSSSPSSSSASSSSSMYRPDRPHDSYAGLLNQYAT